MSEAVVDQAAAPTADAEPAPRRRPEPRKRKGLVIVNTGHGKGKTTAAIGLGVRAAGNRMRVRMIQFIKGTWKTGEQRALAQLAPYFELERIGHGFTIEGLRDERIPMDEHHARARAAWQRARDTVRAGEHDVVILDEIMAAMTAGFVGVDELLALIAEKPPMMHLVLTGRNAPPELVAVADLVSEIQPVKHPYRDQGIKAQKGIEF
ncbi:MAG: cob(I)yrinic acid a,c-diamide adenosyltransferase [Chloroflexi bacterium]|nr:cob(I)yrinic acid a,c-diamide adenosyltransferase [Chloroflexota bacterium]